MKPRILVLHTGGTVGMEATPRGLRPMARFSTLLEEWFYVAAPVLPVAGCDMPDCDIIELAPLLDSADMTPVNWLRIAEALVCRWSAYDGFVVLHGTDTMAWTASALSFMLRGADKPVILTGSQIPLVAAHSDAPENLRAALALAADPRIREVGICFGRRLWRGNRASKTATDRFDAFASFNYPQLAEVETGVVVHEERLLPPGEKAFCIPARIDPEAVAVLIIHPGISPAAVEAVLAAPHVRGLVVESYGAGNMPQAGGRLLDVMAEAVSRGVTLVNTTRCLVGAVAQDTYATGAAFARAGIVSGGDMTLEASHTKLHLLIARGLSPEEIRRQICLPCCGEMTPAGAGC